MVDKDKIKKIAEEAALVSRIKTIMEDVNKSIRTERGGLAYSPASIISHCELPFDGENMSSPVVTAITHLYELLILWCERALDQCPKALVAGRLALHKHYCEVVNRIRNNNQQISTNIIINVSEGANELL